MHPAKPSLSLGGEVEKGAGGSDIENRDRFIHRVLQELRDFALRARPATPGDAGLKSLRSPPLCG